jgi:hypothetical protein
MVRREVQAEVSAQRKVGAPAIAGDLEAALLV